MKQQCTLSMRAKVVFRLLRVESNDFRRKSFEYDANKE